VIERHPRPVDPFIGTARAPPCTTIAACAHRAARARRCRSSWSEDWWPSGQGTVFNRFGFVLLQGAKNLIASSFTLMVVPAWVASFPDRESFLDGSMPSLLLDQFVGNCARPLRYAEAERLRRLEVDDKLEVGWLLNRQVRRLSALEYPININGSTPGRVV
jgi:hypothetical protein